MFLGSLLRADTSTQIAGAAFMVVPSEWYESFGRTATGGVAPGAPVVCSAVGGLTELVEDGVTGFTFEAGNAGALVAALRRAVSGRDGMGPRVNARAAYDRLYSPRANQNLLMAAYRRAPERRSRS